ncbi:MAG: AraC family transcriptional regulator [Lachnospiraceae bacterium]|nr:AraC family transcriptional regulator [Lachnospiraceae bacterium]
MKINQDYSFHNVYNVGSLPLYSAKEDLTLQPQGRTPSHWNSDLEILFMDRGSMYVTVNGCKSLVRAKDIFIIDPGCLHFFQTADTEECVYYVGLLSESLFFATKNMTERFLNPVFHCFKPDFVHIPPSSSLYQPLYQTFVEIHCIITAKTAAYELLLAAKCYEILQYLCNLQHYKYLKTKNVDGRTAETLRLLMDYILRNYHQKISIEDLCKAASISRNTCFQLFQKFTEDTPAGFIMSYRLSQSQTLLADTSLSISEIADRCGFSHQSHFTQSFSRAFRITPLQFRKLHLDKQTELKKGR